MFRYVQFRFIRRLSVAAAEGMILLLWELTRTVGQSQRREKKGVHNQVAAQGCFTAKDVVAAENVRALF